jgi:hypothetical protein
MIIGNFTDDLNIFLEENKGRSGASKYSTVSLNTIGSPSKGTLEQGRMYAFRYFTNKETFYDTYPIVIGLGSSFGINQLGINLHYIPYDSRISLIKDIVKSFPSIFESQLKYAGNAKMQMYMKEFTYDAVNQSLGKKYNLKYAIRQYNMKNMKDPRVLGYEDWYVGAVNDSNFFFGGNINEAQALYNKNI